MKTDLTSGGHAMENPARQPVLGSICIALGAYSSLWYLVVTGANPWLLSGPFRLGLDRPAGYDELLQYQQDHIIIATSVALAGVGIGLLLLLAGIGFVMGCRWARGVALLWIVGKSSHAIAFAALTYAATQAQISGIPDPQAPMYDASDIMFSGALAIVIGLLVRLFVPFILLVALLVGAWRRVRK